MSGHDEGGGNETERPLSNVRFSEEGVRRSDATQGVPRCRTQGSANLEATTEGQQRGKSDVTSQSIITGHIRLRGSGYDSRISRLTEPPEETDHIILGNRFFRWFINITILVSALEMGFAAGEQNAQNDGVFIVCEHIFTAVFAVEMFLKLWVLRVQYFTCPHKGMWNCVDFCIAWVSIIDMWVLSWAIHGDSSLEIFRLFRLCRVARIAKLARSFPEVVVVVQGLIASLRAMVWILVLLLMVIYTFSLIFVENVGTTPTYPAFDTSMTVEISEFVDNFNNYFYFGTVFRSMVTLWGVIILAEWDVARPIYELQPAMFCLLAALVCVATLGIFNVIIGVIVERTTQAIFDARELSQDQIRKRRTALAHRLANVMFEIDSNKDGVISRHELMQATENAHLMEILEDIQLPQGFTLLNLHMMLDLRGHGVITKSEFIMGMLRLIDSDAFSRVCLTQFAIGQLKISVNALRDDVREDCRAIMTEASAEMTAIKESSATMAQELRLLRADLAEDASSNRTSRSRSADDTSLQGPPAPAPAPAPPAPARSKYSPRCSPRPSASVGGAEPLSGKLADAVLGLEAPLARLVELARGGESSLLSPSLGQEASATQLEAECESLHSRASQRQSMRSLEEELEQVALSEDSSAGSRAGAGAPLLSSATATHLASLHGIPPEQKLQDINVGHGQGMAKQPGAWPKEVAALIRNVAVSPAPLTMGVASVPMPPRPLPWRQ